MKLKDLINEVKIYQNNFIKIGMVENDLKTLFPENTPQVKFDTEGLYVVLDTFQFRDYENKRLTSFILTDAGLFDEMKNTKKYYVEYFKQVTKTDSNTTTPTEEPTEPAV